MTDIRKTQWRDAKACPPPTTGEHILVASLGQGGFGICGGKWQDFQAVVHYWPVEGEEGFYLSAGASSPIDDRPVNFTHWTPLVSDAPNYAFEPAPVSGEPTAPLRFIDCAKCGFQNVIAVSPDAGDDQGRPRREPPQSAHGVSGTEQPPLLRADGEQDGASLGPCERCGRPESEHASRWKICPTYSMFRAAPISGEPTDTERLDWLESIVGNLDAKTEVFFAGLGITGTAAAYQCEVAPSTGAGSLAWRSYQGVSLRDAIDIARGATNER